MNSFIYLLLNYIFYSNYCLQLYYYYCYNCRELYSVNKKRKGRKKSKNCARLTAESHELVPSRAKLSRPSPETVSRADHCSERALEPSSHKLNTRAFQTTTVHVVFSNSLGRCLAEPNDPSPPTTGSRLPSVKLVVFDDNQRGSSRNLVGSLKIQIRISEFLDLPDVEIPYPSMFCRF